MTPDRFMSPIPCLDRMPVPGDRESRFPQPRDRTMNHPRKEPDHV